MYECSTTHKKHGRFSLTRISRSFCRSNVLPLSKLSKLYSPLHMGRRRRFSTYYVSITKMCTHVFGVCMRFRVFNAFVHFIRFVEHDSIFHYSICAFFSLSLFFYSLFNRVNVVNALDTHVLLIVVVVVRFARVLVNYGLIWKLDNKIHKVHQCEQAIIVYSFCVYVRLRMLVLFRNSFFLLFFFDSFSNCCSRCPFTCTNNKRSNSNNNKVTS